MAASAQATRRRRRALNQSSRPAASTENVTFENSWVLLIDISGFSERVGRHDERESLVRTYRHVVDTVLPNLPHIEAIKDHFAQRPGVFLKGALAEERRHWIAEQWSRSIRIFSDSIIVFFTALDPSLTATSLTMGIAADGISSALWQNRLPHRGAIAFGECYVDSDRDIFLGQPIVEAHRWEQSQKWLGVSLSPGSLLPARTNAPGSGLGIQSAYFEAEVIVPTADGEVITWAINPFTTRTTEGRNVAVREEVLDGFLDCFRQAERAGSASVIAKYVNTARFLRKQGLDSQRLRSLTGEAMLERIVVSSING